MIWLTWRQFRVQAVAAAAALVVAWAVLLSFRPQLTEADSPLYWGGMLAMYLMPALIGIFWGVPLVARELEAGTHNVVWNQTVTRARWLTTKLAIPGIAAIVVAGLLSVAVGWWASPIDATAAASPNGDLPNRIEPVLFGARGIVPVAYTAFAFALGVLVGILARRVLAAMAVTLVAVVAVIVATPFLLRPHLLPPVDQAVTITADNIRGINASSAGPVIDGVVTIAPPAGAWVLTNETVGPDGTVPDRLPVEILACAPPPPDDRGGPPDFGDLRSCFAQLSGLGYHQHLVYQPASRFWALQWAETAVFAALTALLVWFSFRSLRRLS